MTHILVADDEADVLESTQLVLQFEGFTVTTVQDGERILATLKQIRPDVLLQDVNMPGLDLAKLIPLIRADPDLKRVKILVFTASVDGEALCQALHADGSIPKPFDSQRIRQVIGKAMAVRPKGVA